MKTIYIYIIIAVLIGFIVLDNLININPKIRNVIYGIMALIGIYYIIANKNKNGLNDMFKKKEE